MELILDRVTRQYKNKIAVDRLSYTFQTGVYGLLGANGAGKTTLMRMMCGVLKPTSGEITLDGIPVAREEYRKALGYLPQDFGYYPEFTALEFLLYVAALKGIPRRWAREKALPLLALTGLSEVANRRIKTFSGGMKQRLGIAQALLGDPRVLILDEPTVGLDPKERVRFRNILSQLGQEKLVLLSTHIVSDVENIAGTILMLKNGQLIHAGSLSQIIGALQNKVWTCRLPRQQAQELMERCPIINLRPEGDAFYLRLVSEEPPAPGAVLTDACLEDLYLYYFREEKHHEFLGTDQI